MHYIPESAKEGTFQVGLIPEEQFDRLWSEDGRLLILIAPIDVVSTMKFDESQEKSNRLCFSSEKLNLQKNSQKAVDSLQEAIQLDKQNSIAYSLLGGILNEQNSDACLEYYKKSIELNKNCFLAFRGLGNYYLKKKEYEEAEKYYDNAIEINPTRFGPIYKNRGIARLEQNKKNEIWTREGIATFTKIT